MTSDARRARKPRWTPEQRRARDAALVTPTTPLPLRWRLALAWQRFWT